MKAASKNPERQPPGPRYEVPDAITNPLSGASTKLLGTIDSGLSGSLLLESDGCQELRLNLAEKEPVEFPGLEPIRASLSAVAGWDEGGAQRGLLLFRGEQTRRQFEASTARLKALAVAREEQTQTILCVTSLFGPIEPLLELAWQTGHQGARRWPSPTHAGPGSRRGRRKKRTGSSSLTGSRPRLWRRPG